MELEKVVADLVQKVERRFYGKYRGFVVSTEDPKHLGRVRLKVPSVLGPEVVTGWAMPCVPYGGQKNQGFLCIPEVGAGVWVEFEEGDLEFPIWVGTFWGELAGVSGELAVVSETPALNEADGKERQRTANGQAGQNAANGQAGQKKLPPPNRKIIKTKKGHTIQFEDADEQEMVIIVEATHKHVVTLNKDGIQITDGVNGNRIVMGQGGIQIGIDSSGASEPLVLGNQFVANVEEFLDALNKHTHPGSGSPPNTPPLTLEVPLSVKPQAE